MSQTGTLMGFVHRRRRGAELFLLVLALAVGIGAYAAVGLGLEGQVPADIVGYGGWLTALIVAAHVTVRPDAASTQSTASNSPPGSSMTGTSPASRRAEATCGASTAKNATVTPAKSATSRA